MLSLRDIDIHNIDMLRDINRKLDTIDKIKNIQDGYFYLLENIYFDIKDLLEDLMLYKLNEDEYIQEINNIQDLFNDDLRKENIEICEMLEESC